jgi:ribosome-binding ATPase
VICIKGEWASLQKIVKTAAILSSMLIGIVGKPSSGKSTFFRAATLAEVETANYPFTTIKPNHAIGFVKVDCVDKDFGRKCNPRLGYCLEGNRFVPIDLIDVAGLVPGAHKGHGMGLEFLNDLNQADALIHIIDVSGSTNEKGEQVDALSYDPASDVEFLETELDMWYFGLIKKGWEVFVKKTSQEKTEVSKALARHLSGLRVSENLVEEKIKKLNLGYDIKIWDGKTLKKMGSELRKETKPMIIACNKIDVDGAAENFERLTKQFPDHFLVPCSAESELALKEAAKHELIDYVPGSGTFTVKNKNSLNEKQGKALEFIKKNLLDKFQGTGVQKVLDDAVFNLLKRIAVFPGGLSKLEDQHGNVLPDCFLMEPNSTSLDFAYRLHTDIGDNFIKAIDVKNKKPVGKDYILKNRDVIEIATSK